MQFTPDHPEFVSLANLYATKHLFMAEASSRQNVVKPTFLKFFFYQTKARCHWEVETSRSNSWIVEAGVTNSADWWPVEGTMQDFNYLFSNCLELNMELACDWLPSTEIIQVTKFFSKTFAFSLTGWRTKNQCWRS